MELIKQWSVLCTRKSNLVSKKTEFSVCSLSNRSLSSKARFDSRKSIDYVQHNLSSWHNNRFIWSDAVICGDYFGDSNFWCRETVTPKRLWVADFRTWHRYLNCAFDWAICLNIAHDMHHTISNSKALTRSVNIPTCFSVVTAIIREFIL
jgi:hypothetical protein